MFSVPYDVVLVLGKIMLLLARNSYCRFSVTKASSINVGLKLLTV